MPTREPFIFHDGSDGWLALARGATDRGLVYLEPFEAAWGLGCPIVNIDPALAAETLASVEWHLCLLLGVLDDNPRKAALVRELEKHFDVHVGDPTTRFVSDLRDGFEPFLGRRGRNLRRSIRRSQVRANALGVSFLSADRLDADTAFERICEVERLGWKDRSGVGFLAAKMSGFYKQMIARLREDGALRLLIARYEDRDVGYILGGVFSDTYRGLQFSFSTELRDLGLGNLAQVEQIKRLCDEEISFYDLGTTGEHYKTRWADQQITSTALIAARR